MPLRVSARRQRPAGRRRRALPHPRGKSRARERSRRLCRLLLSAQPALRGVGRIDEESVDSPPRKSGLLSRSRRSRGRPASFSPARRRPESATRAARQHRRASRRPREESASTREHAAAPAGRAPAAAMTSPRERTTSSRRWRVGSSRAGATAIALRERDGGERAAPPRRGRGSRRSVSARSPDRRCRRISCRAVRAVSIQMPRRGRADRAR